MSLSLVIVDFFTFMNALARSSLGREISPQFLARHWGASFLWNVCVVPMGPFLQTNLRYSWRIDSSWGREFGDWNLWRGHIDGWIWCGYWRERHHDSHCRRWHYSECIHDGQFSRQHHHLPRWTPSTCSSTLSLLCARLPFLAGASLAGIRSSQPGPCMCSCCLLSPCAQLQPPWPRQAYNWGRGQATPWSEFAHIVWFHYSLLRAK